MISMSTRTVTTKRHEYLLPRPATQSDLGKCLSNASHDVNHPALKDGACSPIWIG